MENQLQKNIKIAQYMGWRVAQEPIDENYPTQRWFYSKVPGTKQWSGGKSVHTTHPDFEQEVIKTIDKLWYDLCNPNHGRQGGYCKSYDAIMEVVDKMESETRHLGMHIGRLGSMFDVHNNLRLVSGKVENRLEGIVDVVLQYIDWKTEQEEKSNLLNNTL